MEEPRRFRLRCPLADVEHGVVGLASLLLPSTLPRGGPPWLPPWPGRVASGTPDPAARRGRSVCPARGGRRGPPRLAGQDRRGRPEARCPPPDRLVTQPMTRERCPIGPNCTASRREKRRSEDPRGRRGADSTTGGDHDAESGPLRAVAARL